MNIVAFSQERQGISPRVCPKIFSGTNGTPDPAECATASVDPLELFSVLGGQR